MVITSVNNKAVDNIGKDLLEEIDYFNELVHDIKDDDINYSGMLCARLGNKVNMDFFKDKVINSLLNGLKEAENYKANKKIIFQYNQVFP